MSLGNFKDRYMFGVDDLDQSAQSADLNHVRHFWMIWTTWKYTQAVPLTGSRPLVSSSLLSLSSHAPGDTLSW